MYWPLTLYCMKATGREYQTHLWNGGGRCVVKRREEERERGEV